VPTRIRCGVPGARRADRAAAAELRQTRCQRSSHLYLRRRDRRHCRGSEAAAPTPRAHDRTTGAALGGLSLLIVSGAIHSLPLFVVTSIVSGVGYSLAVLGRTGPADRAAPAPHRGAVLRPRTSSPISHRRPPPLGLGAIAARSGCRSALEIGAAAIVALGSRRCSSRMFRRVARANQPRSPGRPGPTSVRRFRREPMTTLNTPSSFVPARTRPGARIRSPGARARRDACLRVGPHPREWTTRVVPVTLYVTNKISIADAVAAAADTTVVVNNAGVGGSGAMAPHPGRGARRLRDQRFGRSRSPGIAPVLARTGGGALVDIHRP